MVGERIHQYQILKKLGAGGQGTVYKALDTKLDRTVVIKVLPPELTAKTANFARFEREAKLCSQLDHPNICTIYDYREDDGTFYIAMQYVGGKNVRQLVDGRALELNSALQIEIQTCDALSYAHSKNIIHRDVKAGNVMVNDEGQVKILDFGLAKLIQEAPSANAGGNQADLTELGIPYGTATYAAPEQAKGEITDHRADIFSSGVLLYEMLTGIWAFQGKTVIDVRHQVLHGTPKPISEMRPEPIPPKLQEIIDKALAKEPKDRYQKISEMRDDLRGVLQEISGLPVMQSDGFRPQHLAMANPVTAQPTISREYVVSRIKTHKLSVLGILLTLIIVFAGVGYYFTRNPDNSNLAVGDTAIDSIAVMPFVNASGNKDIEYLSDGMTETLISSLSKLSGVSVKARSSVFRYKGKEVSPKKIGEELNVKAVLFGRLVQRGDDLRLSLELVDAQTEIALWSENYDRKMSNLVSLQNEIARNVSEKLKLRLTGEDEKKLTKKYTANPEAYQAYLKGRLHWNKRTEIGIKKGIEFFKQAIELDPNYALAWTGLADSYIVSPAYSKTPPKEAFPKARSAAEKAIALDPDLAEAHTSLAMVMLRYYRDFAGAEKEFQTAIRLNPKYATAHHWYCIFLTESGKHGEAIREGKIAQELEPLSLIININLGRRFYFARRYDEATQQHKKTVETFPDHPFANFGLAKSLAQQGKFTEARSACNKIIEKGSSAFPSCLGYVYAKSGKKSEAYRILAEDLKANEIHEYNRALIYAMLDEKDKAFVVLEQLSQNKHNWVMRLTTDPSFDNLRDDPRYKEMVKRIGFPE